MPVFVIIGVQSTLHPPLSCPLLFSLLTILAMHKSANRLYIYSGNLLPFLGQTWVKCASLNFRKYIVDFHGDCKILFVSKKNVEQDVFSLYPLFSSSPSMHDKPVD